MTSLLDAVAAHDELAELDPARRRLALRRVLAERTSSDALSDAVARVADAIDGYGPLTALLDDDAVTDVLVNGPHDVWAERAGRLERASVRFDDGDELRRFVDRWLACAGARVDASRPIADARLTNGARIHVVLPPIAPHGPLVSIRRFPAHMPALDDLIAAGMLDDAAAGELASLVAARATLAITGGTGSGKTTLLNALLRSVGRSERVVTIEETPELRPSCSHVVSLVARPPNVEGRGATSLADLVVAALRMRPDRIVVGEVRGGEALAALEAMSTGHDGSMVTVHARSAHDALERIVTLALRAGSGATEDGLRRRASDAFDAIVHLERRGGRRRLVEIARV
ncbi:MAG TPA: ATPase, T2SS/T4P/T4SS family [Actinomycetota bacterium]|nr:ATPase, T2SS/T4P/T4SS family [Actinomycetota bacterium]